MMDGNLMNSLPRRTLGLLFLLSLASGQLLFAQKNSNQPPVALNDSATVLQGNSVIIPVLANDYDPDGDPLDVQNVRRARGVIHVQDDGTLLYQPTPNFVGEDVFLYTIVDGNKGKASANVVVLVTAPQANHDPLAVDDNALTDEDVSVAITVLVNDSDEDGDALEITSVSQGANGSASIDGNGIITYTPAPDFNGSDSFNYTISDGNGGSASADVSVTIKAVNDAPVADDLSASTSEDESVVITLTGSDVDNDPLTFSVITDPANGQLSGTSPNLTYFPDANFNGQDSFTFQVSDGQATDQGTVAISVGAFNDPPLAADDAAITDEDTPVDIDVLANDSDPEGDALSVENVTQGSSGAVTLNPDGSVTYVPNADFNGSDSFTYSLSDGNGGTDQGTVAVTISAINDDPVANDDNAATQEDTPITIDVLANDYDVDGDELTVQNVTQANAVVHPNPDGTLAYEPNRNFSGVDEFYYTIVDPDGAKATATVTVTVGSENDLPVAVDDAATTNEDAPVTINVLANDSDADGDALSVTGVTQGTSGSVTIYTDSTVTYTPNANFNGSDNFNYTVSDGQGGTATAAVSITVSPINDPPVITSASTASATEDEEFIYTATADDIDGGLITFTFSNLASWLSLDGASIYGTPPEGATDFTFTILADDGHEENNLATLQVAVTVGGVNDPPVAVDLQLVTDEDQSTSSFTLTASDPENDLLTFEILAVPAHGVLEGTAPDLIYTPEPDYFGEDNFTFQVSDGTASDDGAVSITVNAVNDAPVANDDEAATQEETPITIDVLANDYDVDGDVLTIHNVTQANAVVHPNPDGTLAYEPNPNFYGIDEFTYTIEDPDGAKAIATVIVTVSSENDAPVADDQSISTSEDESVAIILTGSDEDGDPLTFSVTNSPANGQLTGTPPDLSYTPTENYFGSDFFTFTVNDGELNSETATVSITVQAVNDPPVAIDDEANTPQNTPVTIDALANDSDIDSEILTITGTTDADYGTVDMNLDGTLTYNPNDGYSGTDNFQYTVSDGEGGSATATVTIYVNISETAVSDSVGSGGGTIQTGIGAAINIPAGALNAPVNIVISQFAAAPPGIETAGPVYFFGPTGTYFNVPVTITVSYDPDRIPPGLDASRLTLLRYNESDGTWEIIPGTVDSLAHVVTGQTDHFSGFAAGFAPNRAPTVSGLPDGITITEDTALDTLVDSLPNYFTDPDEGDHLNFSATALDSGLTALVIDQYLALIAFPAANFSGSIRIVISATDDWNVSTLFTMNLTITEINDAPEFLPGFHASLASVMNIQEDDRLYVKLLAEDVEGDDITFHATSDTSAVTLAITQDTIPELVVMPARNWFGTARIGISATDGLATTNLDPVTLTVRASNDIPDAFDLLNPGNGNQLLLTSENNEDSLTFEWEPVNDPDNDPVSYTFVLSDSLGVNWEYGGLETNVISIACADIAATIRAMGVNSVSFWWSVVAIAGPDTVPTSQGPFQLTIDAGTFSVDNGSHVPQLFALHQNYPNPFNPVTTIRFEVPRASHVLLVIYDMRGREVIRLVDEFTPPGYNKVLWNSSDAYGRPVPSGVYIARMLTPEYTHVIKMTIVR